MPYWNSPYENLYFILSNNKFYMNIVFQMDRFMDSLTNLVCSLWTAPHPPKNHSMSSKTQMKNVFCKGSDDKYFRFGRPLGLWDRYSILALLCKRSLNGNVMKEADCFPIKFRLPKAVANLEVMVDLHWSRTCIGVCRSCLAGFVFLVLQKSNQKLAYA